MKVLFFNRFSNFLGHILQLLECKIGSQSHIFFGGVSERFGEINFKSEGSCMNSSENANSAQIKKIRISLMRIKRFYVNVPTFQDFNYRLIMLLLTFVSDLNGNTEESFLLLRDKVLYKK